MRNYISEEQIQTAIIDLFVNTLGYEHIHCLAPDAGGLNDGSRRADKSQVFLSERIKHRLKTLNPTLPTEALEQAYRELTKGRSAMSRVLANQEVYHLIKDGVPVEYEDERGREQRDYAYIIDFKKPENNEFLLVSEMWIRGEGYRRPDLLVYVNGLPLVFIELKNSNVKLETAYQKNLIDYHEDIPQLFDYNAFCILSNGLETRVGSFNADWEHFGLWLRVKEEDEEVDKRRIEDYKVSLDYAVLGLCEPERLLDYVENFILYYNDAVKIVAKNHQFLGVKNAIQAFENREGKDGKLGVFWHTQGSGKSYSMIFFARKIFRKYPGNYTFLIVTDREDLDGQIYRNFLNTKTVTKALVSRPKNSQELREFLGTNKRFIFTLIHKFRWPKGKDYPLLSERDDIIVIVDEAHRTQYATLADNMRTGLPNAQFIAFTGTPLLGKERKTNKWFGEYVSEYNFAQAIDDGATVPLFYTNRVPEVMMANEALNEDLAEILEDEELSQAQREKLERDYAQELEIIKRDDRLETIAKDIVYHFPRRGYRGKAMVISVDKFTAVRMYDKVQYHWGEEKKRIQKEISRTGNPKEKEELKNRLRYMQGVDMAVVVSKENGEEEKFEAEGLDIRTHRKRLESVDENGHDIEYKFKDSGDPLQIVFVCAMWLTGFDVKTLSTLYLDKPMKNHTLMQTIARANRVAPGKKNGEIIDYYNVFRNIKRALADYGQGENANPNQNPEGVDPVQEKEQLFTLLKEAIRECLSYCRELKIGLEKIELSGETFQNLEYFNQYADILLSRDEYRSQFQVYDNTTTALYDACRPEILKRRAEFRMVEIISYLRGIVDGRGENVNLNRARRRISNLLDTSIITSEEVADTMVKDRHEKYVIRAGREVDLSKINFDKLRQEFKQANYKNIEIADLRAFIEEKLRQMLSQNVTRIDFAQRLQEIIERYNSGGRITEDYFEDLIRFAESLRDEDQRHIREGLTEEELELFDLLYKDKLTEKEKQAVKNAAKGLLHRLKEEKPTVLVQDWHKDTQLRLKVKSAIEKVLDDQLPQSYDRKTYSEKCQVVFDHFLYREGQRGWAA